MEKIKYAQEQFALLKDNELTFDLEEKLRMASTIRDNVVSDKDIDSSCSCDGSLSQDRKVLLDEIQSYLNNLISSVTSYALDLEDADSASITDFQVANNSLCTIVSNELADSTIGDSRLLKGEKEMSTHVETLKNIYNRGKDCLYTVLLMGEYQTGKTTFINSIVGQHIGAIGDGNTTSAVPLTLSYGESIAVEVFWKTDAQLKLMLSDLSNLSKYIEDFDISQFDITRATDRTILLSKINDFRHHKMCPGSKEPGCKALALCSLILQFYGDDYIQGLKSLDMSSLDIPAFTRFPMKFESRWHKKGSSDFSVSESIFAFIEKIHCYVPSERLKSLNCKIVDSPGLFSNAYDTHVTEQEMVNADAILYLLPFHREFGEDITSSLYYIHRKYDAIHRKLFIVNNWDFSGNKKFFGSNCDNIHDMFGESMNVYRLDARLAYLGELKNSYDKNLLSSDEIDYFIRITEQQFSDENEKVEFNNFLDAWDYCVYYYKRRFRWEDKTPTAADLIKCSCLDSVLSQLLLFVEKNKSFSFIYANGVGKLAKEVSSIKSSLQMHYIEPYQKGRSSLENLWENRFERAEAFSVSAKPIVKKHLFESIDGADSLQKRLSDVVYNHLFTSEIYDELVVSICLEIYYNKWSLMKCGGNKKKIEAFIGPKIESVVTKKIVDRIIYWNDSMRTDQEVHFAPEFKSQIRLMKCDLKDEWSRLYEDDNSFRGLIDKYFKVDNSTSGFAMANDGKHGNGMSTSDISIASSIVGDIASIVALIVVCLTPTILSIILACGTNPIGWVFSSLAAAGAAVTWLVSGEDILEKNFVSHQAPKIRALFDSEDLYATFKSFISSEITKILTSYQDSLTVNLDLLESNRDKSLSTPSEMIEQDCFEALRITSKLNNILQVYSSFIESFVSWPK